MWDDQPLSRPHPPAEMPPPTRAFLSQFNRSFTPPALINDPHVVDRKLTVTPFLFGTRPLYKPRNPFAVDPAVERAHHYMRPKQKSDAELCPSPRSAPIADDEYWSSDEDLALDETTHSDDKTARMNSNSHEKASAKTTKDKSVAAFSFRILEPESSDNTKFGERNDAGDRVPLDVEHFFDGPQMMELWMGPSPMMTARPAAGSEGSPVQSYRTGGTWDEWD